MFKFGWTLSAVLTAMTLVGCSSEAPTADNDGGATKATPASNPTTGEANQASPTAVVSEFLDRVRRGGAAQVEASRLLTARAQAECQRTGLKMGSMGSPDARFEVTRSEPVPDSEGAALVHSLWIEPTPEGTESTYQVVWAMQNESAGWRISGLVMELEPGTEPVVIDFENGDQAASTLGLNEPANPASSAVETQATLPSEAGTTEATVPR